MLLPNKFILIEGIDGGGKSQFTKFLEMEIKKKYYYSSITRQGYTTVKKRFNILDLPLGVGLTFLSLLMLPHYSYHLYIGN